MFTYILKFFLLPGLACENISIKTRSIEGRFVIRRTGKYTVLQACVCTFQPGNLQEGALKGLPTVLSVLLLYYYYYYYEKEQEEKEERECKFVISAPNTTILEFPMKTLLDPETKLSTYKQGRRQYLHRHTENFV